MAHILVVDDDEISLQIVSSQIRKAGHTVQACSDGFKALEFLDNEFFNLMVTDANMPMVSGYNLVTELRKRTKFEDLPVIFVTGRRGKQDVLRALKSGVDDYVIKPVDHSILLKKIDSLLASKQIVPPGEKLMTDAAAIFSMSFTITEMNEQGVILKSVHRLPLEFKLQVISPLFEMAKITAPTLRVVSCELSRHDSNSFTVRTNYFNLPEHERGLIREYIQKNKSAA